MNETSATIATPSAIRLKDVQLSLGSGAARVHILKGFSFDVAQGTSLGLIGPSGSGKSTLLMVIGGLERADSGIVEIAGQSFESLSEDQLATFRGANIGIVFQSFHLISNMTALENVVFNPHHASGTAETRNEMSRLAVENLIAHFQNEQLLTPVDGPRKTEKANP